jgi:1,4-dihydroxy-2-naphthoyl-CoA hydrolase
MEAKLPQQLPLVLEQGFDALYGLELIELSDEIARGRVIVREELKEPAGLVHGGVHAAIAEALASFGTAVAVLPAGKLCMGLSNQTSFLRPVTDGVIEAVATRRHRGRTTWVWEVEISDEQGRLCVLSRVTMAIRDP